MASGRQSDISADTSRSLKAGRIVDRRLEAERSDRTDTRHGHEPSDLRIITCQLENLTIEIVGLLLDGLTCLEQRPNHSHQLGTILDQFLGPHGKDIELGTAIAAVLIGGVGGWAATAQLAGAVIAPGTVVVESNLKKVQHPTGGVIGEILVKEGDEVDEGQVVLRLDDTVT